MNAFLVEHFGEGITTTYYCGPGDWCTNPNHAKKFKTELAAVSLVLGLYEIATPIAGAFRAAGHSWVDV